VVIQQAKENLFNSSVCEAADGFVMAYESNDPKYPPFTVKFARSKDLLNWTKLPDVFGADRYTACPCIRYLDGYFYLMYTEHRTPRWFFETWLARSKDLKTWQLSPANPVLSPDRDDEGICTSDPDVVEYAGKTYLYYAVGDQRTWMNIKRAIYPGTLREFFESRFADVPATCPNP
jgi:alpha-L-fucosidase